jgi:hypothetical protein
MEEKLISKRWFIFALTNFALGYIGTMFIVTGFEVTLSPIFFIAANVYPPIIALGVAYFYFRKSRNDWTARLVTAAGWSIIVFALSVLLMKPVWGVGWVDMEMIDLMIPHWKSIIGIIVAGMAAHHSDDEIAAIVKEG